MCIKHYFSCKNILKTLVNSRNTKIQEPGLSITNFVTRIHTMVLLAICILGG